MQLLILLAILLYSLITWKNYYYGLYLLFLLLPTYLIRWKLFFLPSTFLELMILVLILFFFIKNRKTLNQIIFKIKEIAKNHPSFLIATTIFFLSSIISIFTSINWWKALGEWRAFYFEPLIIFFILILEINSKKRIEQILFFLLLGGFITAIFAIYQHFTGFFVPYTFWAKGNSYRVTGWYGYPNAVGLFLAPLISLSIYLAKEKFSEIKNNYIAKIMFLVSILFLPLGTLAIIFSKGTGPLLGVLGSLGILLLVSKKTRLVTIGLGIVALVSFISLPANHAIKNEVLMKDWSGFVRLNMWAETVEFLTDHPWQGAGLASYATRIAPYHIHQKIEIFHLPHNLLLSMWVNLGIFGAIGFFWILVWFARVSMQKIRRETNLKTIYPYLLSAIGCLFVIGLVDTPYLKNDLAIFFWLLPALLINYDIYGKS